MSETASARPYLSRFCVGLGCDIGFGGDPIVPSAITIDTNPNFSSMFMGDARRLDWFNDDVFDYLYSSHLLEDFTDTATVLREWFRVLKPGGLLILFLPDQKRYEDHCARNNFLPNQDHKHSDFSLVHVLNCVESIPHNTILTENPVTYNPYSFAVVFQKP